MSADFQAIIVETGGAEFSRYEHLLPLITRHRRESIERKKNDKDKLLSLTAGLLLMTELSARLGVSPKSLVFEHGAHGKPYIKGSDLQFSLSHTGGAVCAAFSRGSEIGIDVESRSRRITPRVIERAFCDEERAAAATDEDYIRMWVCKEAFLKRLGIGVTTDLRGVNTMILPDTVSVPQGDFWLGLSGSGAFEAEIQAISMEELSKRAEQLRVVNL